VGWTGSAIAGDVVADGVEAAEFLDVDVNDFARCGALIARPWLGRFDGGKPVEAMTPQDAADSGRRQPCLGGNRSLGALLAAQGLDGTAGGKGRSVWR
jgi:hypothetical protein